MAQFEAVLMHGDRGGEGRYEFDGPDDLLAKSPVKVIRTFMEYLETSRSDQIGHIDFEIHGALKNHKRSVVTGMGDLMLQEGAQPFVVFINKAA